MSMQSEVYMSKSRFGTIKEWMFGNMSRDIPKFGDSYFYPIGGGGDIFDSGINPLKQFLEIPELNAIINIRAKAMASWKLSVISKGTGLEAANNQSLIRVIKKPNWFQSQIELWRQSSLFRDIYGNEFIYFLTPFNRPNTYVGSFTIDPSRIKIEYDSNDLYFLDHNNDHVKYYYMVNHIKIPLDKSKLIHLNDNRVDVKDKDFLKGNSKIKSLAAPLENIRKAYKKRGIILDMPIGVMTNAQKDDIGQSVPFSEKHKKKLLERLMTRGAYPILTNLMLNYRSMTANARQMGLFEEVKESTGRICDAYGVPYKLLASIKEGGLQDSGSGTRESRKQMYEDTIVPDSNEKLEAVNDFLGTQERSWEVKSSFKHLAIFSDDKKSVSELNKLNMEGITVILNMNITDNAKRALLVETYGYTPEQAAIIIE